LITPRNSSILSSWHPDGFQTPHVVADDPHVPDEGDAEDANQQQSAARNRHRQVKVGCGLGDVWISGPIAMDLRHLGIENPVEKRGHRGAGDDRCPVRKQKLPPGAQHVFPTPGEKCAAQQTAEFAKQKQTVVAMASRAGIGLRFIENGRHLAPEHLAPGFGI
jgi:hypothetical protein